MFKLITAYTDKKLIGNGDHLPWNIPEELEFFKKETMGKIVVMGDRTFLGLPGPLLGRKTIILTLDKTWKYKHDNVEVYYSIEELLERYLETSEEVYICGGATIYRLLLPFAKEIIVSHIKDENEEYKGNVYFPEWDVTAYVPKTILAEEKFTTVKYIKK